MVSRALQALIVLRFLRQSNSPARISSQILVDSNLFEWGNFRGLEWEGCEFSVAMKSGDSASATKNGLKSGIKSGMKNGIKNEMKNELKGGRKSGRQSGRNRILLMN